MIERLLFILKCLWYFRRTPKGMDRFFSDLLLSLNEDGETEVLDYTATTNGGTNIYLHCSTKRDLVLNFSMGKGLSIQAQSAEELKDWATVYRRSDLTFQTPYHWTFGPWVFELKRFLRLKLVCRVKPMPITRLRDVL